MIWSEKFFDEILNKIMIFDLWSMGPLPEAEASPPRRLHVGMVGASTGIGSHLTQTFQRN